MCAVYVRHFCVQVLHVTYAYDDVTYVRHFCVQVRVFPDSALVCEPYICALHVSLICAGAGVCGDEAVGGGPGLRDAALEHQVPRYPRR